MLLRPGADTEKTCEFFSTPGDIDQGRGIHGFAEDDQKRNGQRGCSANQRSAGLARAKANDQDAGQGHQHRSERSGL